MVDGPDGSQIFESTVNDDGDDEGIDGAFKMYSLLRGINLPLENWKNHNFLFSTPYDNPYHKNSKLSDLPQIFAVFQILD